MKTFTFTQAFAAALLGLAGFATQAAQPVVTDANYPGPSSLESNTTRAAVHAELLRAKAAGEVVDGEQYPGPQAFTPSTVTRAQVRAELMQARADGYAFNDATYPVPEHNSPRRAKVGSTYAASAGGGSSVTN